MASGPAAEPRHHFAVTKQVDDLKLASVCSCGCWVVVEFSELGSVTKHTLNRICVATDLAYRRIRGR